MKLWNIGINGKMSREKDEMMGKETENLL